MIFKPAKPSFTPSLPHHFIVPRSKPAAPRACPRNITHIGAFIIAGEPLEAAPIVKKTQAKRRHHRQPSLSPGIARGKQK
jgi:hypothetical protein